MHPRSPALAAALALAALAPADPALADAASPYGINTHQPSAAELDRVVEAGIGWVRMDFNWLQMEPARDSYQWALTDRLVADARARGLTIYATLAYTPSWANGGQAHNVPPTDPADWVDFVNDTVTRYRGSITHWGLWNEPNLDGFFTGDVNTFIDDILLPGAAAVHAADPNAQVCGPELANLESGNWRAWLYTVLDRAGDEIDVITHHTYQGSGNEVIRSLGVWVPLWERPLFTSIVDATGQGDKPMWLTETGWHTDEVSEAQQATYYEQTLEGMLEQDWLDKVFFYELRDDPNITDKWGILEADLTPKEAFYAYQAFIASH